jgi:hypothetical protein
MCRSHTDVNRNRLRARTQLKPVRNLVLARNKRDFVAATQRYACQGVSLQILQ